METTADPTRAHLAGRVPAATALRVLLAEAGLTRHGNLPFSEAMVFGIAGGIGAGVFSFHYEQAGFSSLFLAGRHLWQDDLEYLRKACARFGLEPAVTESGGSKGGERQLREMLREHGTCIAWVDMGMLPHRGMPGDTNGSGYHLVTIYDVDEERGMATIGDLGPEPVSIPLEQLTRARGRIKKDKHRLLAVADRSNAPELRAMILDGLRACHQGLIDARMENFTLRAFDRLGRRIYGSRDAERWDVIFPTGGGLWTALTSLYTYIEHYGSGGGLCRPIFAEFLAEASAVVGSLTPLAERYAGIGQRWRDLANAALPDHIPLFSQARELIARRSELARYDAPEESRDVWSRLSELAAEAREQFPLDEDQAAALRRDLQERIFALYDAEFAAHTELGRSLASD